MDVLLELKKLCNNNLKSFNEKIVPNTYPILGVKIPDIKNLAKQIAKQDFENFINNNNCIYFEEVMLEGMVIGYCKCDMGTRLNYIKKFIPKITDWALCDCSVATFKFCNKNLETMWDFIMPYYNSNKEFEIRFAVVVMLDYFVNELYIDKILETLKKFESEFYYAQMAVAWLLSVCFIKFRDKTLNFLKNCKLDKFTFNKTISKCCDSFRVCDDDKQLLKQLKNINK